MQENIQNGEDNLDLEKYKNLSKEEIESRYALAISKLNFMLEASRTKRNTSTDFLLKEVLEYKTASDYGDFSYDDRKRAEIRLARKAVEIDELCGTVLDRLVSLAITKGSIENIKNKKLLRLLNEWETNVGNLQDEKNLANSKIFTIQPYGLGVVFENILERLFVDGDAFVSEIWGESVEIEDETYILPYKIKTHDTFLIDYDKTEFENTGREKAWIDLNLSPNRSLRERSKKSIIELFSNDYVYTTHFKLRPKSFYFWGTSYFKRAFQPIAQKKRIEALETETIDGLIHRLTIIKAGKIDAESDTGIIAPYRLALLENLLSQPKLSSTILWPGDDLSVEEISPKSDLLTYENKYLATNEQTLAALGIPRVLIDGQESSTENWQKFLGVISFLDKIRNNYLLPWINNLLKKIADQNGFKNEHPKYSFSRLKLYDLKQLLDAVKLFYDRGLMSELSALVNGELDFDIEFSRREHENKNGIISNYGGPKYLPFNKNTPDGSGKEGNKSPDKSVDKQTTVSASANDKYKEDLIETFEQYLFSLHDLYSKKIEEQIRQGEIDTLPAIIFAYSSHLKRDIKDQMRILFRQELLGLQADESLLNASFLWIESFINGYSNFIETEIKKILQNNKNLTYSVLAGLIGGFLEYTKTKRLRLYSSSIFNKASMAGALTLSSLAGEGENVRWLCSLTENSCDYCTAMHSKVMSAEKFFQEFPPHGNCECSYDFTLDSIDEGIPEKDPDNWGKTL